MLRPGEDARAVGIESTRHEQRLDAFALRSSTFVPPKAAESCDQVVSIGRGIWLCVANARCFNSTLALGMRRL
jgi:hypothetical protein